MTGASRRRRGAPAGAEVPQRPARPAFVELATALLIMSGFVSFFTSLQGLVALTGDGDVPLLSVVFVTIGLLTMLTGFALRTGRWWLFGVNFVAVAAFLELTSFTVQGLVSGATDLLVVIVLMVHRPWFAWTPDGDAEVERD